MAESGMTVVSILDLASDAANVWPCKTYKQTDKIHGMKHG